MTKFTVRIVGKELVVRKSPHETWKEAADRAAKRRFGRGASIDSWQVDSYETTSKGTAFRAYYRGTVIGRFDRRTCGYPILATAYVTWTPELG
jgi:hypothetical protein